MDVSSAEDASTQLEEFQGIELAVTDPDTADAEQSWRLLLENKWSWYCC